jgi:hypothetical protein
MTVDRYNMLEYILECKDGRATARTLDSSQQGDVEQSTSGELEAQEWRKVWEAVDALSWLTWTPVSGTKVRYSDRLASRYVGCVLLGPWMSGRHWLTLPAPPSNADGNPAALALAISVCS